MKITELLDRAKHDAGIESDYALAAKLGIHKARVSAYYAGKEAPNEFACLRISEITGMPLDIVIATVKAASEKDEKRREAWQNYMKRLGGIAASFVAGIFLHVTLIVTSPDLQAKESTTYSANVAVIQIMRYFRGVTEAVRRIAKMLLLSVYCGYWLNTGIKA